MIKQPAQVRALVVSDIDHTLRHLHARLTLLDPTEHDSLLALEEPQRQALIVELTNILLTRFGHAPPQVKEARYDKTHRAANKLLKEGRLRGEPVPRRFEQPAVNGKSHLDV